MERVFYYLDILFVLALYSIEQGKQFYKIAKLMIWPWCSVEDESFTGCLQTLVNKSLTCMVKQLNYVCLAYS